MQQLHELFYTSRLSEDFSAGDVGRIVTASRTRNRIAEITSLLVFDGAAFAQYIEGPRHQVRTLYAHIQNDPTHLDIVTRHEGPLMRGRRFGAWSLGFGLLQQEPPLGDFDHLFGHEAIDALEALIPRLDLHV
ncbi:hypothetical protein BH10PSE17_BH10PSE17_23450 [soil metagenome]